MSLNTERILKILTEHSFRAKVFGVPMTIIGEVDFNLIAHQILSEVQPNGEPQPQLNKANVSGSALIDYSGYEESLKAALKDAVEQQEQQQREEFNAGREAALCYAVEMLPKHFR